MNGQAEKSSQSEMNSPQWESVGDTRTNERTDERTNGELKHCRLEYTVVPLCIQPG